MLDNDVLNHFGRSQLSIINEAVQKAYTYAKLVIKETPLLSIESAWSIRQIIRNLAVDLMLESECNAGHLDMEHAYIKNFAKNCSYIILKSSDRTLTHNAVATTALPRFSLFREKYASTNQFSMFSQESLYASPNYGIITHSLSAEKGMVANVFLVIPDVEYGYAANKIPLKDIIAPVSAMSHIESDKGFEFQLRQRIEAVSK